MTYTIAENCASITIEDTILDDFVADNPNQDYSVNITFTKNCGTTFSFDITIDDFTELPATTLTFEPSDFGDTDSISDGVYSIVITKTPDDGSSITTETACVLILCDLYCCIIDFLADNPTSDIMLFYQALQWATDCGNCLCDEACTIYDYIQDKLNEDGNTTQCGCSG